VADADPPVCTVVVVCRGESDGARMAGYVATERISCGFVRRMNNELLSG